MTGGLPSYPQSLFPGEHPPTLFHPASPKHKQMKQVDDGASMRSTSTFASTASLLKNKFSAPFKEHNVRKEARVAARSTVVIGPELESKKKSSKRQSLPKDTITRKSSSLKIT